MRFAALLALLTPVAAATLGWMAAPVATAQPLSAGRPTPAAVQPSPPAPGSPQQVSESDQRLLVAMRKADVLVIPAGQQARQRAERAEIRELADHVATDQVGLDAELRALAGKLGVSVQNKADEEQLGQVAELSVLSGAAYDAAFTTLLRAAHGEVFPLIAEVRANTTNDAVRTFAKKAAGVIETQLDLVEGTGLVGDAEASSTRVPAIPVVAPLPPATSVPPPSTQIQAISAISVPAAVETDGGVNVGLVVAICVVEFAATLGLLRLLRSN
ncbi:MAG: DUF4142 domain-containing protein [Actinophytocola sp.]|uniref:DUF4142 domain-containing protein n=1 Tax=Actinophytocola sp. TaxID=1872138 RepID=UPI001320E2C6|nr:DUF4142 domain-containing protein [Actinophytocola sp.]MPZ83571.1 DUF4142 domain-containing protein [Actinophytocola sp.]